VRKLIVSIIGIVTFVWATLSAFSIFSDLKFLVDGWTWSVDHVPILIKNIALAVGKRVSEIVGGYREFVRGLVQMLHLPPLPSLVYDMAGLLAFSIGRGYRLGEIVRKRSVDAIVSHLDWLNKNMFTKDPRDFPKVRKPHFCLFRIAGRIETYLLFGRPADSRLWSFWVARALGSIVAYGGAVLVILCVLFGIDHVYRNFV